MSRQEKKNYGSQEFRSYPLITMEHLPETTKSDYYQYAAKGNVGTRIKDVKKHLICGKTAKSYLYWDNLIYHYKNLAPLYGKNVEFKEYHSAEGWLYNHPHNLRLHNKVTSFEKTQASLLEKRLNLNNPDYRPAHERNMERYVNDEEKINTSTVKRSRFLKRKPETAKPRRSSCETEEATTKEAKIKEEPEKQYYEPKDKLDYPWDPDMLKPLAKPKPKNVPEYYGWTHTNDADSWFLEAHTPSIHDEYAEAIKNVLTMRVVCPKLYSTVVA